MANTRLLQGGLWIMSKAGFHLSISWYGEELWWVIGHMLVTNPILALDVSKFPFIIGNKGCLGSFLWRQKTW